jgi:hypothetical protein
MIVVLPRKKVRHVGAGETIGEVRVQFVDRESGGAEVRRPETRRQAGFLPESIEEHCRVGQSAPNGGQEQSLPRSEAQDKAVVAGAQSGQQIGLALRFHELRRMQD